MPNTKHLIKIIKKDYHNYMKKPSQLFNKEH